MAAYPPLSDVGLPGGCVVLDENGKVPLANMPEGGTQGPPGPQGDPGPAGPAGSDGAQGPAGNDGTPGTQGPQGLPGNDGAPGSDGAQGPQGDPGTPGADGAQGIQGIQGIPGNDGAQGPAGPGVPAGGTTGQVLAKTSGTDYATGWTSAGGGSDPWTKVILGADFTTTGTANAAVAGLALTPAANKRYLVQVLLLLRTATATVGPRPGFSWPTGTTDGGAYMQAPSSATAVLYRTWGARATQNVANTGVPDTTSSHLATGEAYFIMGASPSGTFGVTLASETSGTVVTVKAGSVLLWREI